ncbi:MAG: HlyD family type I secretion periplasmic adaptor subunit [Rhodospirillales bacterium]|nr:HlyD family type I secretion periplasmic adaptor subunit [Rhodospirillales bacterium]
MSNGLENPKSAVLRGGRQERALAQSMAFPEEDSPNIIWKTLATAVVGVLALMGWAGFVEIDIVAKAPGQVIPSGETTTLSHPDGGTVSEILVGDGEIVEKGQILLRFDNKKIQEELKNLKARQTEISLMAAELRALSKGGEPDFSFVKAVYKPLVEKERFVFASLRQLMDKRRRIQQNRVAEVKTKLTNILKQEDTLGKKASLLEDELKLREDLYKKKLTTKNDYLKAKRQVKQIHKDIADLAISRRQTNKALKDVGRMSLEFETRIKSKALDDLGVLTNQLDALNETLENLKDKLVRLDIVAPEKGVVRGAQKYPLGTPVPAGAGVVKIIPLSGETVVETRIRPADIDRVKTGQRVTVNVKAPGFARFGGIVGKLVEISSSTFTDNKGRAFYKGIIALEKETIGPGGPGPGSLRLMPGMAIEASIKTASKTLLSQLF